MAVKKTEKSTRPRAPKRVEPAPAPPRPAPPTTSAKPSRLRRLGRGERVSVYVPPEMAEELRVRCARERRSVSDAVTEALAAWLRK